MNRECRRPSCIGACRGVTAPASLHVLLSKVLPTLAVFVASTVPTSAQTTNWGGAISPDWFVGDNWLNGLPRRTFDVNINTGTPNATVVASPGAEANNLSVGQNGTGMLTTQSGGTLLNEVGAIGNLPGGVGSVTVTGPATSWTNINSVVVG